MPATTKAPKTATKTNPKDTKTSKEPSPIAANTTMVVTLPWSQVEPAYDNQLKKGAKTLKVKGFRQGKVPVSYAKKMLDQETLMNETINQLLPEAYHQAIHEHRHHPVTHPDFKPLKVEWGSDWEIEASFGEVPPVTIKGWQKTAEAGLKKAETDWKKKQADEAKAKKDQAKDAKAAKADVPKDEKAEAAAHEEFLLQHVFATLAKEYGPAVPELLIREQTRSQLENLSKQLEQMGANLDQYLERRNQKFEDLAQEMAVQSLTRLQLEFVLQAIEADLKIEISEDEVKAEYEKIMTTHQMPEEQRPPLTPEVQANIRANLSRQQLVNKLLKK